MADLIKKIKIKKQDGTFTDYIPIGAEAQNISTQDGDSVQLKLNKKPYYYNNVSDMKADTKLKVGDMAVTLGYYDVNDGGNGEYRIISGDYTDDGGKYHELNNSLFAELIIKKKEINAKQYGAYGDGVHDDTIAINKTLNNTFNILIPEGNYYITSTITVPTLSSLNGKEYIATCKGTFIFNDNFTGEKLMNIQNKSYYEVKLYNFSFVHTSFLNKDRHSVENTTRTTFDGVVVADSRRVLLEGLKVVGISNRALVINSGYETKIINADIWGSNLIGEAQFNTSVSENLNIGQNSYYTTGIEINGNDNIFDNIVVVGYSIGMSIKTANMINNYHVWGYKVPLIYGIVIRESSNILNNLYLDSITDNGETRYGAGIYEIKKADLDPQPSSISVTFNMYNNIFPIISGANSVVVETGDPTVDVTGGLSGINNVIVPFGKKGYRTYNGAIGNPYLMKGSGNDKKLYHIAEGSLKYDTEATTIRDVLKSIITNYISFYLENTNGICFVTNKFNNLFTNGFQNSSEKLIYNIESFDKVIIKATVQRYGWPNPDETVFIFFRGTANTMDTYSYVNAHSERVNSLPNPTSGRLIGSCVFYNNKPYWLGSDFVWRDANGDAYSSSI